MQSLECGYLFRIYKGEKMKNSLRFVVGIIVPAFILASGMVNLAAAADKMAAPPKVLVENEKVKVFEITVKPGETADTTAASTGYRAIRTLQGSKIVRTFADGKKEANVLKAGAVIWLEPGPAYSYKNIGKTVLQFYIVQLK